MQRHWCTSVLLALSAAHCLLLSAPATAQDTGIQIAIVTYLGNDFILKDGCPLPECNARDRACLRRNQEARSDYAACIVSEDKDFHGCVTDGLTNGDKLTVPVYASFCSGRCYEKNPQNLEKLERCPFVGQRHELSPELQRRLGVNVNV